MRLVWVLVAVLVPTWAIAGSLGDAAKREKDRRQKNKDEGRVVRAFDDDKLQEISLHSPHETVDTEPPAADTEPPADPTPTPTRPPEEPSTFRSTRPTSEDEPMWRERGKQARQRIESAQSTEKIAEMLRFRGCPLRQAERDRRVEDAKRGVARAKKDLEDLEERARRASVPPGWLR